jgi:hypothetical protein
MDELLHRILKEIEKKISLEPITLPEDLKRVKLPLGLMDMHCFNYKAERVRKMYFMRFKAVRSLDVLGMAIYPKPVFDLPIFVSDLSGSKKKVFTYINFVPLFKEPSYITRYIEPMKLIFDKYNHFPPHKVRDWMKPYLSPYAIYSIPERTHLEELQSCVVDYLTLYLDLFSQVDEIKDVSYQDEVKRAQEKYISDLTTYDASRKMLGRIIGMGRANRIFQEVIS